jgi:hypothetical protein
MYYRQFITLEGDSKALGRVVLEARDLRARATLYLQGLKEGAYRLLLLAKGDDENFAADLALVHVGEQGRYENRFEFDRENIADSGLTLENIDGAAIILPKSPTDGFNPQDGFSVLLSGFRGEAYSWRVNLNLPQITNRPPVISQSTEPAPPQTSPHDEIFQTTPPPSYETDHFEYIHPNRAAATTGPDPIEQFFAPQNIVDVFRDSTLKAQWVTTTLPAVYSLGFSIGNNPFIAANAKKYRHVLLGRLQEAHTQRFILGVPDIVAKDDILNAQNNMHTFKPCHPQTPTGEIHGYWLLNL